jgi:predicted Zn-dependent protease
MLEGEILVAEQKVDAGISELQTAVKEQDALKYDEPPAWMIPIRHSLGAVLMKTRRFAEAEQVYRDDLARLPDNGWSLFGLAESLRSQNKNEDEVAALNAKFQKTWAKADTKITTSCLCQARK